MSVRPLNASDFNCQSTTVRRPFSYNKNYNNILSMFNREAQLVVCRVSINIVPTFLRENE